MMINKESGDQANQWAEYGKAARLPQCYLMEGSPVAETVHHVHLLYEKYQQNGNVCNEIIYNAR